MYQVSQEFQDKIRSIVRSTYARVTIDYTDPFIDQSINTNANENANISYPKQTADGIGEPFAKIASMDGSWVLGEGYALAPDTADDGQMGWWGSKLAGIGGVFTSPLPALTVEFFSRPILKLKVVGDNKRQEWPVDFAINLYSNGNLMYTETVVNNGLIVWEKDLTELITQITKMELVIQKWSHAGRQAKIVEYFTSIQEVYEGEDILLLDLNEEREVSHGGLPVGVVSSNEISVKLSNETRKFDAGNKQSQLYELVKANRRIKAWVGIKKDNGIKEWVPLGIFWTGDWKVPEDNVFAEVTGRDRLELLRKSTYSTATVQQNKTLYDLALNVLQDAGMKPDEYWIDTELQQYTVRYSYFEEQTHREALRKITEACLGQCYCDRDGIIRVEGPSFMQNKVNEAVGTYFLDANFPSEITGIEAYGISADDYFRKDNPAKWSSIANYIEVETKPLQPDVEKQVYKSNDPVTIATGETKNLTVYYNETPCIDATASIQNAPVGCAIQSVTYYAWGSDIQVYSANSGTFELIINAKPLKVLNKEKAIAKDDNSILDNGTLRFKFPDNPLIQTLTIAQDIANKLLQTFKDPRRDVEIDWRGNPALLLGDIITAPDYKEEKGYYYVTSQEIEFAGYLRAKLSGRKAL